MGEAVVGQEIPCSQNVCKTWSFSDQTSHNNLLSFPKPGQPRLGKSQNPWLVIISVTRPLLIQSIQPDSPAAHLPPTSLHFTSLTPAHSVIPLLIRPYLVTCSIIPLSYFSFLYGRHFFIHPNVGRPCLSTRQLALVASPTFFAIWNQGNSILSSWFPIHTFLYMTIHTLT